MKSLDETLEELIDQGKILQIDAAKQEGFILGWNKCKAEYARQIEEFRESLEFNELILNIIPSTIVSQAIHQAAKMMEKENEK